MASADWKVKIELDINDLRSELSGLEKEINGLTKEKHKIELGFDTKTLDSAIKKLDNMLDNIGKGTGDFKQFEKLDQEITSAATSIKELQKAFGTLGNESGAKSLLSSIQSIDTSLTNLSSNLSEINRELINTSDNTTDITVKLSSIQTAFSGIESSLSSMRKVFSDVGDGEEFSPLLNTINEVKNEINGLQSSIKGIGLNLNIDFGSDSEMEAKVQSKISNALQAYQRLYEHLRTSSGGKVAAKSFLDFDIDQFTTSESKLQAYRKFIEKTRNEVKLRSGGKDRLKLESDSKYWNEAAAAMGQVTKASNEMKSSRDTSSLDGLFGKTDLTEVIGQLELITEKLQEISTVATNLSTKFDSGFNVTTSVEEITKLTEKVKILEDELNQLKTASVNQSSSIPSTEFADLNKVQQAAQEAATAKESFVSANEKVASSVDGSVSKLQEEANLFKQVAENAKSAAENKNAFASTNENVADSGKKTGEKGTAGKADVTTDTNDLSASHSENRLPKNVKKYIKKGARTPSIDTGNHDNEITVSSVSDLGAALKKLQSEIIASIDESTSFVKEVTDFYDSNDNLLKSQLKVADKDGSMRTYTTSFNKNEDDSFTAWTSHIETQKFPDENKAYQEQLKQLQKLSAEKKKLKEDARQSEVSTALKDQVNAYKEIQNIREKMFQTSDSNMLSELSKEKKEYQEQYLAASKILKANSDLYDSEKQLGELKKISTKTSNKIAQNQIKSNAAEQEKLNKSRSSELQNSVQRQLNNNIDRYSTISKRMASGSALSTDAKELAKVKKEIETIQNSDILPADKLEASKDRIQQIDIAVDDLKKKLKEDTSDSAQSVIDKYQRQVNSSLINSNTFKPSEGYKKAITNLQSSINELDKFKKKIADQPMLSEEDFADFERLKKNVEDASQALKNFSSSAKGMKGVSIEKEISKINQTLNQNPRYSKAAKEALHELLQELESGVSTKGLDEIHQKLMQIQNDEEKAGRSGKGLIDVIKEKQWYGFAAQIAGMFSIYDVFNIAKQGFEVVKEFDSAFTEMRKVSNETQQSLKDYQATTFDVADTVGTTALQIQDSTADWMRLGESMDEAAQSAKDATILLNVSEFEGIDEATDSLVSMSQAYKDLDKMDIIDVLNNIGNNYSISTDGLATALKDSASSLVTANNDLNEAAALITAGNAITQDPSKTGAGIRTISLRLVGTEDAKQELEEMGESTDGMVTTVSKLRDIIKDATRDASKDGKGFDILDDNGNYKSTYEIMQGLADLYDNIVKKDKELGTNNLNLLLETIAGKNRSNIAASILQNGDMLRSVYEDAQNSEGSAETELNAYLDSVEGKLTQLQNRAQEFWTKVINSDAIKSGIEMLTNLLELATKLVDTIGVIPTLGGLLSGFASIKGKGEHTIMFQW
uniref:phage tail tape measure protein n=1 Tax=Coprococcus catus TaxID=116085 RepID=UPI0022E92BCB|nr:phage tail tape measure protein [Coprococcus catus]